MPKPFGYLIYTHILNSKLELWQEIRFYILFLLFSGKLIFRTFSQKYRFELNKKNTDHKLQIITF